MDRVVNTYEAINRDKLLKAINLLQSADIDEETGDVEWHTWYKGFGKDVKESFDIVIRYMQALENKGNILDNIRAEHERIISEEDAISRILKRMWNCRGEHTTSIDKVKMEKIIRDELPSVTQWHKAEDELPEKNGVYIVSYEDSVRLLEWFNGKWFFYPSNPAREETGTITAWMPLPQPYKAESKDEEEEFKQHLENQQKKMSLE